MLLHYALLSLLPALTAEELLTRSIAHHDPDGRWDEAALELTLGETRPDGSERHTTLRIDNANSFALIGYRFHHDETAGDGEYIVLREEASGAGLTLPRVREWRTHQGDEYLGTDTMLAISAR